MSSLVNAETGEVVATITADEAGLLTARIKGHVADAWILLSEAHERKAYIALGYKSWADYVTKEFELSRSESYRLLDQAKVINELEEGLIAASWDVSRARDISGRAASALAEVPGPEAKAEVFIEATDANDGATPTEADIKVTVATSTSPAIQAIRDRRAREAEAKAAAAGTSVEAQDAERVARENYLIEQTNEKARIAYIGATTACAELLKHNPIAVTFAVINEPLDRQTLARFVADMTEWCKAVKKELAINVRSVP